MGSVIFYDIDNSIHMELARRQVHDLLTSEGIRHLYHANSVVTSCQFIKAGGLIARGHLDRKGLPQSRQYTDDTDVRHSIWFDIFLDTVDIHDRVSSVNKYGPVLFVLSVDLLKRPTTGKIWYTRSNPSKWDSLHPNKPKWFETINDLKKGFIKNEFDQMIVARHCGGELPFGKYLEKIVVDDPGKNVGGVDAYSMAYGALQLACTDAGLDIDIERRECDDCNCTQFYKQHARYLREMFVPWVTGQ